MEEEEEAKRRCWWLWIRPGDAGLEPGPGLRSFGLIKYPRGLVWSSTTARAEQDLSPCCSPEGFRTAGLVKKRGSPKN